MRYGKIRQDDIKVGDVVLRIDKDINGIYTEGKCYFVTNIEKRYMSFLDDSGSTVSVLKSSPRWKAIKSKSIDRNTRNYKQVVCFQSTFSYGVNPTIGKIYKVMDMSLGADTFRLDRSYYKRVRGFH